MIFSIPNKSCWLLLLAGMLSFSACDRGNIFDQRKAIPEHEWTTDFKPQFSLDITDTLAHYDLFITVRHKSDYPFTNLWVKVNTLYPSGKTGEVRHQLILGDNKKEQWLGDCMGDICDTKVLFIRNMQFSEPGEYTFTLSHDMRTSPLPGVMDIGMRAEKKKLPD